MFLVDLIIYSILIYYGMKFFRKNSRTNAQRQFVLFLTSKISRTNVKLSLIVLFSFVICYIKLYKLEIDKKIDQVSPVVITPLKPRAEQPNRPESWLDPWYCDVQCTTKIPCEYKDEVALRIIVLTYNRATSLKTTLASILNLKTLDDKISVEIWIDRSKDGKIDGKSVTVAEEFKLKWSESHAKGRCCIHFQTENAFINLQWTNTWRPKEDTNELALILEDDISISPFAYKWLKATHDYFKSYPHIAGYTLQMENINFFAPDWYSRPMSADRNHKIFLYPVLGTWGYSPHPETWRKYQDWFYSARPDLNIDTDLIKPNVPGILPNNWYNGMLKTHDQESLWDMWHTKFKHDYHLFTVYCNLEAYTGKENVILSTNRKEQGLHFDGSDRIENTKNLMSEWKDDYVDYPKNKQNELILYNYDGSICSEKCCFSTTCPDTTYIITNFIPIFFKPFSLLFKFIILKPFKLIMKIIKLLLSN